MKFNVELLEITKDNFTEAQFMAGSLIDEESKNRVFLNVAGAEAVAYHLEKFGINVPEKNHIHSIKRVVQRIDIADIILPNIHIDVRVVFDDNRIFVPKVHAELGITPDAYVVLKYVNSTERIYLLGFFEPSAVKFKDGDENYYFVDPSSLRSPFDMIEFVRDYNHKTESPISQDEILRGRELSVKVSDHDITENEFKEFLSLLLKSNILRASVLEYDNFETLAARVAEALRVKISKKELESKVVDLDEFMDMESAQDSEVPPYNKIVGAASAIASDDLNGDNLLDEDTLPVLESTNEQPSDLDFVDEDANLGGMGVIQNSDSTDNIDLDISEHEDFNLDESLNTEQVEETADTEGSITEFQESNSEEFYSEVPSMDLQDYDDLKEEEQSKEKEDTDSEQEIETLPPDTIADETELINTGNSDENNSDDFSLDDEMFDIKEMDLDFSSFEDDMSDQAADNFINDNVNEKDNLNDISIDELNDKNIVTDIDNSDDKVDLEENFDAEIKDFEEIKQINEENGNDTQSLGYNPDNEEQLVDFSDIEYEKTDNDISEHLNNDEKNLSNIFSNLGDNVEINRDNNIRIDEEDEFPSDDLIEFPSENVINNYDDIDHTEQSNTESQNEINNDTEIANGNISEDITKEESDINDEYSDLENNENVPLEVQPSQEDTQNSEISFEEFENLDDIETTAPIDQNMDIDLSLNDIDNNGIDKNESSQQTSVRENSVVITDKNQTPGEIFIDINKDSSKSEFYDNEHLEELYNGSISNEDSGLNNGVRVVPSTKQGSPWMLIAGIGGLAVLFVVAGTILFFASKYINFGPKNINVTSEGKKAEQNNLGTDVPKTSDALDSNNIIVNDAAGLNNNKKAAVNKSGQNAKTSENIGVIAHIPPTAFLSVKKLTWEVPDYISYNNNFKQYFQSSGKSIKAALTSDLLLAKDYTYSDQIKISITFDQSGNFKDAKILLSSGSSQVDNIVLQSVNQTLRVLKAPNSLGNDQSTTVILKIYL